MVTRGVRQCRPEAITLPANDDGFLGASLDLFRMDSGAGGLLDGAAGMEACCDNYQHAVTRIAPYDQAQTLLSYNCKSWTPGHSCTRSVRQPDQAAEAG